MVNVQISFLKNKFNFLKYKNFQYFDSKLIILRILIFTSQLVYMTFNLYNDTIINTSYELMAL